MVRFRLISLAFASGFMATLPLINVPQSPIDFPHVRVGKAPLIRAAQWCPISFAFVSGFMVTLPFVCAHQLARTQFTVSASGLTAPHLCMQTCEALEGFTAPLFNFLCTEEY
jgi:hypothetical protein